jgi:hypothetical protein
MRKLREYQTRIEKVYEDYLDEKIPEALYKRKFEEFREVSKVWHRTRVLISNKLKMTTT